MTKKIKIEGMSCMHCVKAVTNALNTLQGVTSVNIDLASKTATVQIDNNQTPSDKEITSVIEDAGYSVVSID